MKRGRACFVVGLLLATSCKGRHEAAPVPAAHASASVSKQAPAPSVSASSSSSSIDATAPTAASVASTTPPGVEARRELEQIWRAAKACRADATAPECGTGQTLAREYPLMHCGREGIDEAYEFAWAAREPLPRSTPFTDEFGQTWYVEPERSPKLARVDERIWSEADWLSVEPHLRFESVYPSPADERRLTALDAQLSKNTGSEGIVRAVFYEGKFIGAYPFYRSFKSRDEAWMLYGFLTTPKAHPLCKAPEARTLPPELEDFAGTWSRLH